MDKPRIKVPPKVERGQPFEVKVLISHLMESGQRTDTKTGERIPRKILNAFVCRLDGREVFRVTLYPAVSANPYLAFFVTAEESGELEFVWTDDDGSEIKATAPIEVAE
jgi:sulfur-oxidizing protein SoxZ